MVAIVLWECNHKSINFWCCINSATCDPPTNSLIPFWFGLKSGSPTPLHNPLTWPQGTWRPPGPGLRPARSIESGGNGQPKRLLVYQLTATGRVIKPYMVHAHAHNPLMHMHMCMHMSCSVVNAHVMLSKMKSYSVTWGRHTT